MSEPTSPDPVVGAPERLHPLFLLTGLGGALRGLTAGYAAIGYLAVSGRLTTAIFGAIALLLFMGVGVFLYWTRFEYRVGESEIRIDSGIVSRRHRSIPFDRIQDVDITQGPIARLLGLAQVKFETGGGSAGPDAEEAVLHAIPLVRAHEIRRQIRASRSGAFDIAAAPAEAERPPVYAMDVRRLLLSGTFNFSLAVFAGLIGLTQTLGDVVGFDPLNRRFWTSLVQGSEPVTQFVLDNRVGAAIAGIVLLLVIGAATGIVRTFVRDYGFRLDRTETGLRRRRGLLTRTDVTLPVKRAQAAIVATGPIRDALGWRELRLQSLAHDEGRQADHVLAPLAHDEEVAAVLAELGWRPLPPEVPWARVSRAYVWMRVIALSPLLILLSLQVLAIAFVAPSLGSAVSAEVGTALVPSLLVLGALAAAVLVRWLAWRRTAYALDGDRLLIRSGWWRRRLVVLPKARIQTADLTDTPLSRGFGISALRFGVAGGGFGGHLIPAIPTDTARQLRSELLGSAS